MRLEMLNYLNTLDRGIVALEVVAAELVRAASVTPDEAADIMLPLARRHRVRILEMQGQFAALKEIYSERYNSQT